MKRNNNTINIGNHLCPPLANSKLGINQQLYLQSFDTSGTAFIEVPRGFVGKSKSWAGPNTIKKRHLILLV